MNCFDCAFCEKTKPVYSRWGEPLEPSYRECTGESSEEDWQRYFMSGDDFPEDEEPKCFEQYFPDEWD